MTDAEVLEYIKARLALIPRPLTAMAITGMALAGCARVDDSYRAVSILYSYPKREVCVPPKISQNNVCMTKEQAR